MLRLLIALLCLSLPAVAQTNPATTRAPISTPPAACPNDDATVFWVLGQSQAASHGQGSLQPQPDIEAYVMVDGLCYLMADPVAGCTTSVNAKYQGSWVSRFALRYAVATSLPVVVICTAAGGYSAQDWISDLHGQWTYAIGQVTASPLAIDYVIHQGGESDAIEGTTLGGYFSDMTNLLAMIAGQTSAPVIVNISTWIHGQYSETIRMGQTALMTDLPNTRIGIDTDRLPNSYRHDQTHFNGSGLGFIGLWMSNRMLEIRQTTPN